MTYSRMEIHYLSMRDAAQHMGKKHEYFLANTQHNQAVQPPLGGMEADVKTHFL